MKRIDALLFRAYFAGNQRKLPYDLILAENSLKSDSLAEFVKSSGKVHLTYQNVDEIMELICGE